MTRPVSISECCQCAAPHRATGGALLALVLGVWLLGTGCTSLSRSTGTADQDIPSDEQTLAEALAHYTHGLICQREYGAGSDEALAQLEKALELDPGRKRLYSSLVRVHHEQGELDEAAALLEKACKENPSWSDTRKSLAHVYQKKGDMAAAAKHYRHALKLDPKDTDIHLRLTALYFELQEDKQAIEILDKAVSASKDPSRILTYAYWWGRKFIEDKESTRSIPCLQFVVSHYPDKRGEFYHILGHLYETLRHEDEAIRNYQKATQEDPPHAPAFIRLAEIYQDKSPGKGRDVLIRASQAFPKNNDILFRLAALYNVCKQYGEAVSVFEQIVGNVAEKPGQELTADFYLYHGAACERAGRFAEAEEIFESCLEYHPETPQVLNYLAYMWAERGEKLARAHTYVTRALKHNPKSGAYADTLGWIYYKQKKYRQALVATRKSLELMGADPVVNDHLGDILLAMDHGDEAVASWKKSYLMDPKTPGVAKKLQTHGVNIRQLRKQAREQQKIRDRKEADTP